MTEIATRLLQEVQRRQIISFACFMELALYCPDFGYYEQAERRIGSAGDFYTSVNTGPLFGQLLASHFSQWLGPHSVQLVEAGAHGGQLAFDILTWLQAAYPELFERLTYCLVEPSARRQQWQKDRLADFAGKIRWVDHIQDLNDTEQTPTVDGVVFSNELLDAFPVHRLVWESARQSWRELGVAWEPGEGRFVWRRMNDADCGPLLARAEKLVPEDLKALLPDGFLFDWSPSASQWWAEAARTLQRGVLLTVDYGLTSAELFAPQRCTGTLRGYFRHHMVDDLLAAPGQQDLTAPVNFSQLRLAGEGAGLTTAGLISQGRFLTCAAERRWHRNTPSSAEVRQFQTLTHPEHLGRAFKVFAQARGEADSNLVRSGFVWSGGP